jgi:hypothetical protein
VGIEIVVQPAMGRLADCAHHGTKWSEQMLWTIAVILLVLWLLGLVSGYTINGFIHILLVIAIIVVIIRLIQGRRPV